MEVSLPPPVVVEEEVKEVLSETAVSVSRPRPPEPEKEVVKRRLERKEEEKASESVASAAAEKAKAKCGGEREGEQKAVVGGMEKGRARTRTPEQRRPKEAGNGRTRSPSLASAQRRQGAGDHPALPCVGAEEAGCRLRAQQGCFCQFAKNPAYARYINSPNARKAVASCGIALPSCR
ncbi:hypothetical protein E2562_012190 [Oryza meyeriana var. granulata]|uniref:Bifunctional inhibitor/plant lipid transfer protein/seed storage helical domain-containing protein n=1 Tax=Oryza meyeriana var. granulata TaxID=110450 RepID=A0A6G1F7G9_9ORYZ|nr:hypothetical protein E2562_012190 [Oryza meyeriana var. granulata]